MNIFLLLAATSLTASPTPLSAPAEAGPDAAPMLLAQADLDAPASEIAVEIPAEPAPAATAAPEVVEESVDPVDPVVTGMADQEPVALEIESTPSLDDILAEPLPQGETLAPDQSLLMDPSPLSPYPDDIGRGDRLTIEPPPQPKFALKDRIRFRQVRTQALADPEIQASWASADTASTDLEKREALKEYYTLLFKRMRAIDKAVVENFEELESESLSPLTQRRVAPSVAPAAAASAE